MTQLPLSSSLEDYLEAIAAIIAVKGHAHTKDIADRLKVKMPSVTNALRTLSEKGLIEYTSHTPVLLTAKGADTADRIQRRHNILLGFFEEILCLGKNDSNDCACKIEHILNETAIKRLSVLCESITGREDCKELRRYLRETLPLLTGEDHEPTELSLDQLQPGQQALVLRVDEQLASIKQFTALGLVNGTLLEMKGRAPFGDLLRLTVMGKQLSLRAGDAAAIQVRLID